jgi:hypothetical protein
VRLVSLLALVLLYSCAATIPGQRCGLIKVRRANWERRCTCVCEIVLGPHDSWWGMAEDGRCKGNTSLTTMECK